MYTIIGSRDTGKTRQIMELAKRENYIVVCKHPERLKAKAQAYGIGYIDTMSYDEYKMRVLEQNPPTNYVVDELNEFLAALGCQGYNVSIDD